MTPEQFTVRLEAFALRDGLTFSTLISLPAPDRAIVVATIAALFDRGALYAERQVNERLKAWLGGAGGNVETDHVHVRRWLVDSGVLARNDDCTDYRLAKTDDEPVVAIARALDCARIATSARHHHDAARARRKDAWMQRAGADGQETHD